MGRLQNNTSIEWVHSKSIHECPLAWGNKKQRRNVSSALLVIVIFATILVWTITTWATLNISKKKTLICFPPNKYNNKTLFDTWCFCHHTKYTCVFEKQNNSELYNRKKQTKRKLDNNPQIMIKKLWVRLYICKRFSLCKISLILGKRKEFKTVCYCG